MTVNYACCCYINNNINHISLYFQCHYNSPDEMRALCLYCCNGV